VEIILRTPQKVKRLVVNIVHSAAFYAADVIVRGRIAIESSLSAAQLQLLYHTRPGQQIQVPIHGSQADFRQPAKDNSVEPRGSGVRSKLLKLLQYHLPLSRVALKGAVFHGIPLTTDNYYCLVWKGKGQEANFSAMPRDSLATGKKKTPYSCVSTPAGLPGRGPKSAGNSR
jgi:hypothetical protein